MTGAVEMKTQLGQKVNMKNMAELTPRRASATIYRATRFFQDSRYPVAGYGTKELGIRFDRSIQNDLTTVLNSCIGQSAICISDGLRAAWKHLPCLMWHALLGPSGQVTPTWVKDNELGLSMGPDSHFASATWGDYQVELFGFNFCK